MYVVLHSKASYVQKEDKPQNRQITNCVNLSSCIHHASWATMIFPISLATFTISSGLSCSASVDSSQSSAASQCRKKTLSVVVRQRAVHKFSDYHFEIRSRCLVCLFHLQFGQSCLPSRSLQGSAVQLQSTPVSPQHLHSAEKRICLSSSARGLFISFQIIISKFCLELFGLFVSSGVWALWPSCLPSRSLQGSAVQLQSTPVRPQQLYSAEKRLCPSSARGPFISFKIIILKFCLDVWFVCFIQSLGSLAILLTFTISSRLSCSASVNSSQSSAASQCQKKTLYVVVRQRAVHKFSDYYFKILS